MRVRGNCCKSAIEGIRRGKGRGRSAGFSLIELLLVVALVGILLSLALPSYRDSVLAGARAEGQSLLLQVAAAQERFYSANNTYSANADPWASPPQTTVDSENGRYQVAVAACAGGTIANCFVATATPQGEQTEDNCGPLTLDNAGQRGAGTTPVADCWR